MKFEIFKSDSSEKFHFRLKASNGQVILQSQAYADKSGVKNGIESVKTNAPKADHYETKELDNGKFHFNLISANKQVIGSSQQYASKANMENGIKSVMETAPKAEVVDLTVA